MLTITNNTVVFYQCFVHERLANGDVAFFELIDLVPYPLCPNLGLFNLVVDINRMLDLLGIKQFASVVVASINKLISLLLMVGMLNLWRAGLK